jgi:hypothetical protein
MILKHIRKYHGGYACQPTVILVRLQALESHSLFTNLIRGRDHLDVITDLEEFAQFRDVEFERVPAEEFSLRLGKWGQK